MLASIQLDLIWTLFWHKFVPRNRQETLKLIWVLVEPAGQIAVMLAIFSFIGRAGGYGRSFALFLLTGVVVLTIVTRGMALVSSAVQALRAPTRLAAIGVFLDPVATLGFKLFTALLYSAALAIGIALWQRVDIMPEAPGLVLAAMGLAGLMGFGLGLIRGHCARFAPAVTRVINIVTRMLLFVSGVFYMPGYLVPTLRDWLSWNPVLHAVELMRRGFYGADYPSPVLDVPYLVGFSLAIAAFGMLLVWANRQRLME
ncbi:MAG: ABC transporter permease [Pseudomonadota bacterium]